MSNTIYTWVKAYTDKATAQAILAAAPRELHACGLSSTPLPTPEVFLLPKAGRVGFTHLIELEIETDLAEGIENPFEVFLAPTFAPFGDRMVLLGIQGTDDTPHDEWAIVGVIDMRFVDQDDTWVLGAGDQAH